MANRTVSPPPSLSARVGLVLLGVVLGIAAGEIAARMKGFEYRPHMRNRVYFTEPDPVRGWRNRAGMAGPYGGDEFLTWVTINEAGQRGPHHPVARVASKHRVAILGDSQAWGDGVGDDETFVSLLNDPSREILNFAVLGYGTDQQLLTLEQEVPRWKPDVVVMVTYLGNDLHDNVDAGTLQFPKPWFEVRKDGGLERRGVPVEHSSLLRGGVEIYRAVMRYSAVLNAIAESLADGSAPGLGGRDGWHRGGKPIPSIYQAVPTDDDRRALRTTARLLIEMGRRTRDLGARPLVVLLPESWQIEVANDPAWRDELRRNDIDWRRPQKVLRRALVADGIQVIDALHPLARASRDHPGRERTYYPKWKHLTVVGHQVLAATLRPRLERISLVTESGESG